MVSPSRPAPAAPFLLAAFLATLAALSACSTRPSSTQASPPMEWRLVPQTTVVGDRRQFFVYGEGLDSARVAASGGVEVERGWIKEDGKVLSLYLTVGAPVAGDSTLLGEQPGFRKITVATRDTVVRFRLKVMGEK